MAAPLEAPGAALPEMRAAGKPWKRTSCSGVSLQTGLTTSDNGTMPPPALRTYSLSTSSICMRAGASAWMMTCCMRPALGKSLTYSEPIAVDSVSLMLVNATPSASAFCRSMSRRMLVPAGRPSG